MPRLSLARARPSRARPADLVASVYASLSARLGKRLLSDVIASRSLRPRLTLAKLLAYLVATLVHALTLLTAAAGVVLLLAVHNPIGVVLGLLLLVMAFELRPRVPKLRERPAPREAVAATLALTGAIARELHTQNVDEVIVTTDFNAALGWVGWRRRRVLWLGVPLLLTLDAQERVAVLGHELGHGVNGDATRGFYIRTALRSLHSWRGFLSPSPTPRQPNLFEQFGNAFMALLGQLPGAALRLLSHLNWRESQRAEYLADYLAAQVAGTDAALSALAKLQFSSRFYGTVHNLTLNNRMDELLPELRRQLSQADLAAALDGGPDAVEPYRLDATHPPPVYRLAFLRARSVERPTLVLSAEENERLEQEWRRFLPGVQKALTDRQLRRLYR